MKLQEIQNLDEAAVLRAAVDAAGAESDGWFVRARALGELQRRAGYKDAAVVKYARDLGIGKTLAFELCAIDRRILLPRLLEQGEAARFPIRERRFYSVAVRGASVVKRTALAILEMAEAARAKDRRFTARKLQEQLGLHSTRDVTHGLRHCLERVAGLNDEARQHFARTTKDPRGMLRLASATEISARCLVDELRAHDGGEA